MNSSPASAKSATFTYTFRFKVVSETGSGGGISFGPYIGMYRQINGAWEYPQYLKQDYSGRLPALSLWGDSKAGSQWVTVDYTNYPQSSDRDPIMKWTVKPSGVGSFNYCRLDYGFVLQGYYRSVTVLVDDLANNEIQPG